MHACDAFVAEWKAGQVSAALAARGIDAKPRRIATSPPGSRRRATLTGRRTKSGAMLGFHAAASSIVTDVPDCLVLDPALKSVIEALKTMVMQLASRKSDLRVSITLTQTGPDVAISGANPQSALTNPAT